MKAHLNKNVGTETQVSRHTPHEALPELLTIDEFRRAANLGRSAAYSLARSGELPVVRFGRLIRISRTALAPEAR